MIPEEEQIRQFDGVGNTPAAWEISADSLLAAAKLLKEKRDPFDPAGLNVGDTIPDEGRILFPELMLRGFGVECLLKALWLKQGHTLATNGKYVGVPGAAQHDLVELSRRVSFTLNQEQMYTMKRLSLILSSGRYPIPRRWEDRKIQSLPGGGWGTLQFWSYPSDDQTLEGVITALECELDK